MNKLDLEKQISTMKTKSISVNWRVIILLIFYFISVVGAFILGVYSDLGSALALYEF